VPAAPEELPMIDHALQCVAAEIGQDSEPPPSDNVLDFLGSPAQPTLTSDLLAGNALPSVGGGLPG
jgi:hypothetical protein